MKKIYLFRHGETQANVDELICGVTNVPLNETGKKQAEMTGKMLVRKGIECLYASYLDRAIETAKIVGKEIGVDDVVIVHDLHETNMGDYEGYPISEILKMVGATSRERDQVCDEQYPNGESRHGARKRFSNAVLDICKKDKNDVIGIAAHGNVLRQFLINFGYEDNSRVKNCEVIEAEYDGENIKVFGRFCKTN